MHLHTHKIHALALLQASENWAFGCVSKASTRKRRDYLRAGLAKCIRYIKIVILPYSHVVIRIEFRFAQSWLCFFNPMLQLT